ncbi:hypothetical protein ACFLY1_00005, partial [Patescibacteria group bacterium]
EGGNLTTEIDYINATVEDRKNIAHSGIKFDENDNISELPAIIIISIVMLVVIAVLGTVIYRMKKKKIQPEQMVMENDGSSAKKKLPSIIAIGIILILAMIVGGLFWIKGGADNLRFLKKESMPSMDQVPAPSTEQMTAPITSEIERIDEFDGWLTYQNERYNYQFRYPPGSEIILAPQNAFSMTPEESAAGTTTEGLYSEYGGEICLTLRYGPAYINISAPENQANHRVICGRSGVGCANLTAEMTSEDIITNQTEDIEIDGVDYVADGDEVNCPAGDLPEPSPRSEFYRVDLENNTGIEYGSRPLEGTEYSFNDYLDMREDLLNVVSSIEFSE